MKYVIAILILIITFSCVNNPVILSNKNKELIELFRQTNSNNLQQTNPDSALIIARKVVALADSINNDSLKMKSQIIIGYILNLKDLPDSAIVMLTKTLTLATSLKDSGVIAQTCQQLAQSYYQLQQYDTTKVFLKKGQTICKIINDTAIIADIYKGLGDIMNKKKQYDSSYYYYQKAANQYIKNKNAVNLALVYNSISNVFAEQELTERAVYYLKKSIVINDSIQNNFTLALNYNNLGIIYKNEEQYDSAIILLNKSIVLYNIVNYKFGAVISTYNISDVYSINGNYHKADSALSYVYDYCTANNIKLGIYRALSSMAQNEIRNNDINKAKNYLNEALALSKTQKQIEDERDILAQIIRLPYMHVDDSINYFSQYETLTDSIFKTDYLTKIADAETKYAVESKNKSIKLLEIKNQKSNLQKWVLVLAIVLIVSIFLLILISYYRKNDKLKKQNELDKEIQKNNDLTIQRNNLNLKLKQQKLTENLLSIAKYQNDFKSLETKLLPLKNKLRSKTDRELLISTFSEYNNINHQSSLTEFEIAFKQIYPNFVEKLLAKYPQLTPREILICELIRLNFHTKQIAEITNNTTKSVQTARFRIRKKINLIDHSSLSNELKSL